MKQEQHFLQFQKLIIEYFTIIVVAFTDLAYIHC